MNHNDKILVSLAAGIAIGAVLGILLAREKGYECEANAHGKKFVKDIFKGLCKKKSKPGNLQEDIEQAAKEAFADNPEEYC